MGFRFARAGRRTVRAAGATLALITGVIPPAAAEEGDPNPVPSSEGTWSVRADRVVSTPEGVEATGEVAVEGDRFRYAGDFVTWRPDGRRLELGPGTAQVEDLEGELALQGAVWCTEPERLTFRHGSWRHPEGAPRFLAREGSWDGARWRLEGASFTACRCGDLGRPWRITARRVVADPAGHAWFYGGWLRWMDLPVLPIPVGAVAWGPRRSGLLAPELAWTEDGAEVGVPIYLVTGDHTDLTFTPTWRDRRGGRLRTEMRAALPGEGEGSTWEAVAGWDAVEQAVRGSVTGRHGQARGRLRSAAEVNWLSDAEYAQDYDPDYLQRIRPWRESRALLASGPWRLDHGSFQDPDGAGQRLARIGREAAGRGSGPWTLHTHLSGVLGGWGERPAALETAWLGLAGGGSLTGAWRPGPLELELEAAGDGYLAGTPQEALSDPAEPGGEGAAVIAAQAEMPLWKEGRRGMHLLRPGLEAGHRARSTVGDPPRGATLLSWESPRWWLGPTVESRRLGSRGVPAHLAAALPLTDLGWSPEVVAWKTSGPWEVQLQAEGRLDLEAGEGSWLATGTVGWSDEVRSFSVGALHVREATEDEQALGRVSWRLPVGGDTWRAAWRVRVDPVPLSVLEHRAELWFRSRCHCLGLGLVGTWSEDRTWPQLSLKLDLGR